MADDPGTAGEWDALVKVVHVFTGMIIWETLSTLHYEWSVFFGQRRYLHTIWTHFGCRITALLSFIFALVFLNARTVAEHCQASYAVYLTFVYLSFSFGTFIMLTRATAVWRSHQRFPKLIAYGFWLASIALNIRAIILIQGEYRPEWNACIPMHTRRFLVNAIGIFVSNSVLFAIMLCGLFVMRDNRGYGLIDFLWHQGVVCMAVVTAAEIPSIILLALRVDDIWHIMLFPFWQATVAICTTRMYRRLTEYLNETHEPALGTIARATQPIQFYVPTFHDAQAKDSAFGTESTRTTAVSQTD